MSSIGSLSSGKLAAAYAGSTDALAARTTSERAERAEEKRPVAPKPVAVQEQQEPAPGASTTQGTLVDTYL